MLYEVITKTLWPGGQYGSSFPAHTSEKTGFCVNCHWPHGWPDDAAPGQDYPGLLVERYDVADDGDDDPLSFALTEFPPGMTIEPGTGAIRWTVPDGFVGTAPVSVTVSDGHGGEAAYPFSLTIREEAPKEPPEAASK